MSSVPLQPDVPAAAVEAAPSEGRLERKEVEVRRSWRFGDLKGRPDGCEALFGHLPDEVQRGCPVSRRWPTSITNWVMTGRVRPGTEPPVQERSHGENLRRRGRSRLAIDPPTDRRRGRNQATSRARRCRPDRCQTPAGANRRGGTNRHRRRRRRLRELRRSACPRTRSRR